MPGRYVTTRDDMGWKVEWRRVSGCYRAHVTFFFLRDKLRLSKFSLSRLECHVWGSCADLWYVTQTKGQAPPNVSVFLTPPPIPTGSRLSPSDSRYVVTDRQLFNLADKVKMEHVLDKNDAIAVYRLCDELSGGLKSGEKRDGPAPPGTSILYWQEQTCNCPPPETLSQLLLHGTGSHKVVHGAKQLAPMPGCKFAQQSMLSQLQVNRLQQQRHLLLQRQVPRLQVHPS